MNYIRTNIHKLFRKREIHNFKSLHRWNIDYSNTIINRKIDMANEDHCGPCGKLELSRFEKKDVLQEIHRISNIDYLIYNELK
jgi:hypothetical protein